MRELVENARKRLRDLADPKVRDSGARFFKEPVAAYGVKSADVRKIAKQVWAMVKREPKDAVFALCEDFWRGGYLEEGGVACELAACLGKAYGKEDFAVFDRWLDAYIHNWAHCDMLCLQCLAPLIAKFPDIVPAARAWAGAGNRWKKRAAAVAFVPAARAGERLEDVFAVSDALLPDPDDMVQKGYGWALKVAGEKHPDAVFAFLMERKSAMPRTAFRYALEKLPPALRAAAMGK